MYGLGYGYGGNVVAPPGGPYGAPVFGGGPVYGPGMYQPGGYGVFSRDPISGAVYNANTQQNSFQTEFGGYGNEYGHGGTGVGGDPMVNALNDPFHPVQRTLGARGRAKRDRANKDQGCCVIL